MPLAFLLPLVAQAGALAGPGPAGLNLPQIDRPAPRRVEQRNWLSLDIPLPASRFRSCLDAVAGDPRAGEGTARLWLKDAGKGGLSATAQPNLCLGYALAAQEQWLAAEQALTKAREAATSDVLLRAQAGGMAGNAALAGGAAERALGLLDAAQSDARAADRPVLAGSIALDRARALVALGRLPQAETALADARASLPDDPQSWLLSATLARRMDKLGDAQRFIENAVNIAPRDADIGVEAGVIAMLAGHEDAARKSWQSALDTAPDSEAGKRAAFYLAQLGSAPKP